MTSYCLAIADATILQGGYITDYFPGIRVGLFSLDGSCEVYPDYATIDDARAAVSRAWLGGAKFEHEGHDFIEDASATVNVLDAETGAIVAVVDLTTDAPGDGVEERDPGNPWLRLGWIVGRDEDEDEDE